MIARAVPLILAVVVSLPVSVSAGDEAFAEATQTPEGLIRALYDMDSFDAGPEPDWEMFRDVFLEDALLVFAPRGERPMLPMGLEAFIQDWKDFFRDYDIGAKGFYETIADIRVQEFNGIAHAFVIFEPDFSLLGPP